LSCGGGKGLKVVVYDLTSENRPILENTLYVDRLRAVRVKATQWLHKLGIECTESVILVNGNHEDRVQDVIARVHQAYAEILGEIRATLSVNLPPPIIRVLEVTNEQFGVFRELAERRLRELIDIHIDRVSSILERQNGGNAERLVRSLRKLRREWTRIGSICRSMGIGLDHDIDYLLQLIDEAILHIRAGPRGEPI
jgi:hypothetical protein